MKHLFLLVGLLALTIGLLKVKDERLLPIQKTIISSVDDILDRFQDINFDWVNTFNGGFYPAQPVHDLEMTVEIGSIPPELSGVFMRVGPNVPSWPPKRAMHVFDGDGMIHSVRFINGKAIYHCQWVESPKLQFEQENGEWFTRIGELSGLTGLIKAMVTMPLKMNLGPESSPVNTALGMTPDGHVWALHEGGLPFRIRVSPNGAVTSVGFDTLDGTLGEWMSAHPKYDYKTGETFFHGKDMATGKFHVGRISDNRLQEFVSLGDTMDVYGFQHDLFITQDYVIIIDDSLRFMFENVAKEDPFIMFNPNYNLSFGVIPRASKFSVDSVIWIEGPVASIVHSTFAYNEGSTIILWAPVSGFDPNFDDGVTGGLGYAHMRRIEIDVEKKTVVMEKITELGPEISRDTADPEYGIGEFRTEFGRSRDDRIGQTTRYGFSGIQSDGIGFNFTGLLKWDFVEKKIAGVIEFSSDETGGEPVFLPRGEGDDEGYIGLFIWSATKQTSRMVLYDASSFSSEPVVSLSVKHRIPLGFHAWWLDEKAIELQMTKSK